MRIVGLAFLLLAGCATQAELDCGHFEGEPNWISTKPDAELEQVLLEAVVGYRSGNLGLTSRPMHEGIYWFESETGDFLYCAPDKDIIAKGRAYRACFAERFIIKKFENGYRVAEDTSIVCT